MGHRKKIKPLIISTLKNRLSYENIVKLVQITTAISKSYLKTHYPSFLKICTQHGLSEDELAEDAILELFARNSQGDFFYLHNFADSLDSPIEEMEKEEVFYAFRAFVQTVAIRQLVKTYAKIDSTSAKLYRNIRDWIRKTEAVELSKDFRGFVICPSENPKYNHRPAFPVKKLEKKFALKVSQANSIPDMLSNLMEIIKNQDKYRHSVPLFRAVQIFKRYYEYTSNHKPKQEYNIDLSSLKKFDHEIIKSEVIQTLQQKILTTYILPEKITFHEANLLNQTLNDIMNDWFDIKTKRSTYFEHTRSNFDIDKAQYEERWRTKIEYLVRIAREQIESYILEGL